MAPKMLQHTLTDEETDQQIGLRTVTPPTRQPSYSCGISKGRLTRCKLALTPWNHAEACRPGGAVFG